MGCNRGVRMPDKHRRQEYRRARWKADDDPKVPEREVPTRIGVVIPQRGDGAFTPRHVSPVPVWAAFGFWAEVNGGRSEWGANEVSAEPGVPLGELVQVFLVRVVNPGEICLKKIYGGKC
jgi:hypothetical protein